MSDKKELPNKIILSKVFDDLHWNPIKENSYNLPFNVICSARSDGKTTGISIYMIMNWNKNKKKFAFIRRNKPECKLMRYIFNDIVSPLTPITFIGDGIGGGIYKYGKEEIGYLFPLVKQKDYKSGRQYNDITIICYDEFMLDRKNYLIRYLPNEMTELNQILNTICRARNDYKVFILGNNLDFMNPYFVFYNVPEIELGKIYVDKKRGLLVNMYKTKEELKTIKEETPLSKLNANTAFNDFALNNEIVADIKYEIKQKLNNDKLLIRLSYHEVQFNVYKRNIFEIFVELKKEFINDELNLAIAINGLVSYNDIRLFKTMLGAYSTVIVRNNIRNQYIYYDNIKTAILFSEMVTRYLQ